VALLLMACGWRCLVGAITKSWTVVRLRVVTHSSRCSLGVLTWMLSLTTAFVPQLLRRDLNWSALTTHHRRAWSMIAW